MAVEGFLGRWARRKREAGRDSAGENVREIGQPPAERNAEVLQPATTFELAGDTSIAEADPVAVPNPGPGQGHLGNGAAGASADTNAGAAEGGEAAGRSPQDAAPTKARAASIADALPDIATLTGESDFSPFMRVGVDPRLRVAALKKLFADPRFNQMDGLDVYIDDYGKPDPLPPGMLRRLEQGRSLGLFRDEEEEELLAATGTDATDEAPPRPDSEVADAEATSGGAGDADVVASGASSDRGQLAEGAAVANNADSVAQSGGGGNAAPMENEKIIESIESPRDIDGVGNAKGPDSILSGEPDRRGVA